jgi:hypothetical protein
MLGSGGSSDFGPSSAGVHVSEVTGQHSVTSTNTVAGANVSDVVSASAAVDPPSDTGSAGSRSDGGGLLSLEPPLASSDYSFSLDDQENLNDLFELF